MARPPTWLPLSAVQKQGWGPNCLNRQNPYIHEADPTWGQGSVILRMNLFPVQPSVVVMTYHNENVLTGRLKHNVIELHGLYGSNWMKETKITTHPIRRLAKHDLEVRQPLTTHS